MGTKRHLADSLVEIIRQCRPGAFLDLFSGMCAVGKAIAPKRQVWSNDLQRFAQLVARTQFCTEKPPLGTVQIAEAVGAHFASQKAASIGAISEVVTKERDWVNAQQHEALAALFDDQVQRANQIEKGTPGSVTYDLFLKRYAGTYFSFEQAAEIDAIRASLDRLLDDGTITDGEWEHKVHCLCVAMSRCANTTGHFAQALYPKAQNIGKIVSQRRRSIHKEWLNAVSQLTSFGTPTWRSKNLTFGTDAPELLLGWGHPERPSVIYADPPYTQDQYSRYYHLYETAVLYDYPVCSGRGLYRDNRAVSDFSLASKVEQKMDALIAAASQHDATFILSYPRRGLMSKSDVLIPQMIVTHFGNAPDIHSFDHKHSTMGASKGATQQEVEELIYVVRK